MLARRFLQGMPVLLFLAACPMTPPGPGPTPPGPAPVQPVVIEKTLMIRDVSVVDDPARTAGPDGAWSFGRLVRDMAPAGEEGAFVKRWLASWESDQAVSSGFSAPRRTNIRQVVINPWKAKDGQAGQSDANWAPNLANAPFRLLAIVFRPDLAVVRASQINRSGEGRFVFGVVRADGQPLPFTVIFEYELIATTPAALQEWGRQWNELGSMPFGAAFNATLQQVTDRFSGRDSAPLKPTGNALNQIRTNEIALALGGTQPPVWELREFNIDPSTGFLATVTVKQNPDLSFNGTPTLAAFLAANEAQIKDRAFVLPERLDGQPFLAASALVPGGLVWEASGGADNQTRHIFALGTCNGCHHRETGLKADGGGTNVGFLHIGNRVRGQPSRLSVFLDGGQDLEVGPDVVDPVGGETRQFNDLAERRSRLEELLAGNFIRFQAAATQRAFRVH